MSPDAHDERDELKRRHPWASLGWEMWGLGASMGTLAAVLMLLMALAFMLRFA
ncbi:MAG TPA: hypothetical protein VFO03_02365 [Gaiellaceae bacterium]|nr:hypothetical protein [Gaiellaceae bacterium]